MKLLFAPLALRSALNCNVCHTKKKPTGPVCDPTPVLGSREVTWGHVGSDRRPDWSPCRRGRETHRNPCNNKYKQYSASLRYVTVANTCADVVESRASWGFRESRGVFPVMCVTVWPKGLKRSWNKETKSKTYMLSPLPNLVFDILFSLIEDKKTA